MKKYKFANCVDDVESMNEMGKKGWEFICFKKTQFGYFAWFKKELEGSKR